MTLNNLAGQTLGQYELREILGIGGMGVAYRGYQRNLEREVAIKILFPGLAAESGYLERFYREAKTAAALEHAHIVPVYDYGVQDSVSYVVMRLLPGGTLEDRMAHRLEQNKPLPSLGEVSSLLTQLASALDYAHGRGVIHRDIKPSNIMFDDQGIAYIVDFGIAKLVESSTSYTASGSPIGTPLYMPPEQWRSETLRPAADQYALAVTIYQLLTGRLPFEATTPYGLLHKHLNEDPAPAQTYRADLPRQVQDVLERAMQKDAAERWESVTAFAQAFALAIRGQTGELSGFFEAPIARKKTGAFGPTALVSFNTNSPLVTITKAPPAYRQPVFWVMGGLLLVALVVVLILLLSRGGDQAGQVTIAPEALRGTVVAELGLTQTAQIDAGQTADAAVALALTGTAERWTPTPTLNFAATETRQANLDHTATADAFATTTQEAVLYSTALAGATSTQDALLIMAGATADARASATQQARYTAATATQASLDQAATLDAEQAATQQAISQTATAEIAATQTQIAQATAAQQALLIAAEQTANARATGTQAALDDIATASAATPTPTITPQPPDLRAVYNGNEFILINVTNHPLNLSALVFESQRGSTTRRFDVITWASSADPSQVRAGGCFQVVTNAATQTTPPRRDCPTFLGWFRAGSDERYFWVSDQARDTFTVRLTDSDTPFATCVIGDGECTFALP